MGFWWSCAKRTCNFKLYIEKMKYIISFILIAAFFETGCHDKQEATQDDIKPWTTITIVSEEDTRISINSYSDTAVVNIFHAGSFFAPLPKNKKIKIDTLRVTYNLAERDAIFKLAKEIISNPPPRKGGCTDFVGELEIGIDYGGFTPGP